MQYMMTLFIFLSITTEISVRFLQYKNKTCKDFDEASRVLLFIGFISWLGFGLFFFPDAPLKAYGAFYCGKFGRAHQAEEYSAFLIWQNVGTALLLAILVYSIFGRFLKRWQL